MSPAARAGDLLPAVLRSAAARPLLTYYDDRSGERTELSAVTLDNWVAKTANLLQEGAGVSPGDRVVLWLPAHWQTAVWLLACFALGAEADLAADPAPGPKGASDAAVLVSGPAWLDRAADSGVAEVIGLSLRPLGGPLEAPPAGVTDYATEVPAYADRFSPWSTPTADDPGLCLADHVLASGAVVEAARADAARWGLSAEDRVLSTLPWDGWPGLSAGLLAPLAAGASVVLCPYADPATLPSRAASERTTAAAFSHDPDVAAGPAVPSRILNWR